MGLYDLPFDGIKGIRDETNRLRRDEEHLLEEAKTLKNEARKLMGWMKPISLVKVANKAYAPLVWRDMTKGRVNRLNIRHGLASELGKEVLASLPDEGRKNLLDIEFRRIHLNHALGLVQYGLARLERLEGEFDAWRRLMRDVNQH